MSPREPTRGASTIRVVVVDDHPIFRRGVRAMLAGCRDIEIVGEASDGQDAADLCRRVQPDVVLMDLVMPGMDGFAATPLVAASCPGVRVIALSGYQQDELVHRALAVGMIGYLVKDMDRHELAMVIRAVATGPSVFSPQATGSLVRLIQQGLPWAPLTDGSSESRQPVFSPQATGPPRAPLSNESSGGRQPVSWPRPTGRQTRHRANPAPPRPLLTQREHEVLALIAQGLTDRQIAERLVVSTPTIYFHVRAILFRLGVPNRTAAVAWALQHRQDSQPTD